MNTLTAIGMALLFVVGLYLLIVTIFIIGMFLYKFILGATIRKIPQEEFPAYLISGYFTHKKRWLYFTLFFFGFHSAIYMQQRMELIGNDRAYLEAKEYFAAAGVVTLYRKTLNNYFEIDHPIMRPINAIHMKFYDKGIAFIPQSDGEYDYWKYRFDLYYYVRKVYAPIDPTKSEYSKFFHQYIWRTFTPQVRTLLDDVQLTIKNLREKLYADQVIRDKERYLLLPSMISYYETLHLAYYRLRCERLKSDVDKRLCIDLYAEDELLPAKDREYIAMIDELLTHYSRNKEIFDSELRDNPHIVPLLLATKIGFLSYQVHKVILNKQFQCTEKTVLAYIDERRFFEKFVETEGFKRMNQKEQKHYIEWWITEDDLSEYYRYAFKKYCGIEFKLKGNFEHREITTLEKQKLIEESIHGK